MSISFPLYFDEWSLRATFDQCFFLGRRQQAEAAEDCVLFQWPMLGSHGGRRVIDPPRPRAFAWPFVGVASYEFVTVYFPGQAAGFAIAKCLGQAITKEGAPLQMGCLPVCQAPKFDSGGPRVFATRAASFVGHR
jgi:hypothetical protein